MWGTLVVVTAAALLVATEVAMVRVQRQVRVIGVEAAPQAATASDLYFALSDLDGQVARLVLVDDAEALSGTGIDALSTYHDRGLQVDADLERALRTATTDADRATVRELLDDIAVYRQWAWQALTVESQLPPQPPGKLPPAALGYYTQATNVLHLELLPTAQRLRDSSRARLDQAYAAERVTEAWGIGLAAGLGGVLLVLLVLTQRWLARRFRRRFNPALLAATLITFGLVAAACVVLAVTGSRLSAAQRDDFAPYLALSQARAISYDAAADTSRYLISDNLAYYDQDFTTKSDCLIKAGQCGITGLGPLDSTVLDRWTGYQRDHHAVVGLADAGRTADAIDALTGIRRGDAAFDFSYFDGAISQVAVAHKQSFDVAFADSQGLLTGWSVIPVVALGLVILLVPLALRKRLEEYR